MSDNPKVLIIAGPNGAGKTTFATRYLLAEAGVAKFLNADLIASGLSPFDPGSVEFRASRLMLEMIEEQTAIRESFAIETTLSGQLFQRWIPKWREAGFSTEIHFLFLDSADLAIGRVQERVRAGGHSVPAEVVRRRYERGWRNFQELYKDLVDKWTVYNNSGIEPVILASGTK
ncbi:MAG: AAA family ATPase [Gammaproteobacteria bacterium]|nr:AAA family ATPase [Gammaproteobacteria bacterium]